MEIVFKNFLNTTNYILWFHRLSQSALIFWPSHFIYRLFTSIGAVYKGGFNERACQMRREGCWSVHETAVTGPMPRQWATLAGGQKKQAVKQPESAHLLLCGACAKTTPSALMSHLRSGSPRGPVWVAAAGSGLLPALLLTRARARPRHGHTRALLGTLEPCGIASLGRTHAANRPLIFFICCSLDWWAKGWRWERKVKLEKSLDLKLICDVNVFFN